MHYLAGSTPLPPSTITTYDEIEVELKHIHKCRNKAIGKYTGRESSWTKDNPAYSVLLLYLLLARPSQNELQKFCLSMGTRGNKFGIGPNEQPKHVELGVNISTFLLLWRSSTLFIA